MTRIWSPGTVANPKAPMRTRLTTVITWLVAVSAKTPSTTVSAANSTTSVVPRRRSAARPPTRLPTNSPPPNSTSSHGTDADVNPPTSVSVNAMYVNAPNIPPNPSTVMAIENHTWALRNAASSPRSPALPDARSVRGEVLSPGAGAASGEPTRDGTSSAIPTSATTPMAVMAQNVARHPAA